MILLWSAVLLDTSYIITCLCTIIICIYVGKKRKRCGECTGCVAVDCGSCKFCSDKPKFGGRGKKKKPCINRKCLNLHEVRENPKANAKIPLSDVSNTINRGNQNSLFLRQP